MQTRQNGIKAATGIGGMLAVLMLCFVPEISTWLPDLVMGPDGGR